MFTLINDNFIQIDLCRLTSFDRSPGELPFLEVQIKVGTQGRFRLLPVPSGRERLRLLLGDGDAVCRVKATELRQIPHLLAFMQLPEQLKGRQTPMGDAPLDTAAEVFVCKPEEVVTKIRHTKWWLDYGLSAELSREVWGAYSAVRKLLRFASVEFPPDGEMADVSWGRPEGNFGMTAWDVSRTYEEPIAGYLRAYLNNARLTLELEKWVYDPRDLETHYAMQRQWNDNYPMWGSFS